MTNKKGIPIFQNPDLDGRSFEWLTDSNTGIVFLHGFTATTVEVRTFAKGLREEGFNVSGPLLPGHGESPEALNKVTWKDWYRAAEGDLVTMQARCKNIFLAGESVGALLALLLAKKYTQVKGLLLFSPALIIPGLWKARFLWPFKEYIFKKNVNLNSSWQGFNVVPLHGAIELTRLQSQVRRVLGSIHTPVIIFQGKRDTTIDPMSSEFILEAIGSEESQLVWLKEAPHVILLEGPIQIVMELSLDFIRSHI